MIRTTLTFHMPTLRLVGTLLVLAALAGLPTSAWAEFRIGVWQPGGVVGVEGLFIENMAEDLDALARSGMWREIYVYPIAFAANAETGRPRSTASLVAQHLCFFPYSECRAEHQVCVPKSLDSMKKTGDDNKQATGLRRPDLSLSHYSI